jgi:excisionase family DNA binding protein
MDNPAEGWVTTTEAAEITGYSITYMRQLANRDRIEARKVGRDWLIERTSLLAFKAQMDRLGNDKHNPQAPWRDEGAQERQA